MLLHALNRKNTALAPGELCWFERQIETTPLTHTHADSHAHHHAHVMVQLFIRPWTSGYFGQILPPGQQFIRPK